jgi:hypothetical protein
MRLVRNLSFLMMVLLVGITARTEVVVADVLLCDLYGNGCRTDPGVDYLCGTGLSNAQCLDHLCKDSPANSHDAHDDLADTCNAWCEGASPYNTQNSTCDADCHAGPGGTWCDDYFVYCECLEARKPS